MTLEFGKDGKMKMTKREEKGGVVTGHAYYKVKDDKIRYKVIPGVKPVGEPGDFTIKKLSERELVLEVEKDQTVELKRKK